MNNRMKQARKERKLTLKEVADLILVTESAVSRYERGSISPSDAVVQLFCDKLNISESWLRTGEGEMELRPPEDIVDRLAREYRLGPSGVALLRAVARVVTELPEELSSRILDEVYDEITAMRARRLGIDPQAAADQQLRDRLQAAADQHRGPGQSSDLA